MSLRNGGPNCVCDTCVLRADNARLAARVRVLEEALRWCEANWTKAAVDRGAGLPMIRAALAAKE